MSTETEDQLAHLVRRQMDRIKDLEEIIGQGAYLLHNYGSSHMCDHSYYGCDLAKESSHFVIKYWEQLAGYQEVHRPNDAFNPVVSK